MARPATNNSPAAANNSPRIVGVCAAPPAIKTAALVAVQCVNLPILPNSFGSVQAGLGQTIESNRMAPFNMSAR